MTIVTLIMLLAVPVTIRLLERRTVHRAESIPTRLRVRMTCPKCAHEQEFRTGPERCGACGAGLLIEVEEPRCECGYLLYRLAGNICPECGRPVPDMQRWMAPSPGSLA